MTFSSNATDRHRDRRWYLTTFATYLAAPLLAALAVVVVAFAEAFPSAVVAAGLVVASLIGPSLDIWRRRNARTRRRDERAR